MKKSQKNAIGWIVFLAAIVGLVVLLSVLTKSDKKEVEEQPVAQEIEEQKVPEKTFKDVFTAYEKLDVCSLSEEPVNSEVGHVKVKEGSRLSVYDGKNYSGLAGKNCYLKLKNNSLLSKNGKVVSVSPDNIAEKEVYKIKEFPKDVKVEDFEWFFFNYDWKGMRMHLKSKSFRHCVYDPADGRDVQYFLDVVNPVDVVLITKGGPEKYAVNTKTGERIVLSGDGCWPKLKEKRDKTKYLYAAYPPEGFNPASMFLN